MKNLIEKIIGIGVILAILLSNVVMAATRSELQSQQTETKNRINSTQKELEEVQAEKSSELEQVQSLNNKISEYQSQIDELNNKISDLNNQINEAQSQLDQAQEDFTKQEELLKNRLIATYEAGETTYLDVILSSKGLTDFISNYYLIQEIAQNDKKLLDEIQEKKDKIENAKKTLEDSKTELNTSKTSKQNVQNQLSVAKKEKDQRVAQLSESEQQLQKDLEELRAHESNVSRQLREIVNKFNQSNSTPAGGTSSFGFGWPVANTTIGTTYGERGRWWSLGYHTGVDFPVSAGTPVFAVGNGVVCDTGYNSAYGNFVEIYHGSNVYSFYAHGTSVTVGLGQSVTKGQQVLSSGATGNVTGAHLHFEIRTPGSGFNSCVNPMPYLP